MTSNEILKHYGITRNNIGANGLKELSRTNKLDLALDNNCPKYVLHILAQDRDESVREKVSLNPNLMKKTMLILADDISRDIRFNIAVHPNCPFSLHMYACGLCDKDGMKRLKNTDRLMRIKKVKS